MPHLAFGELLAKSLRSRLLQIEFQPTVCYYWLASDPNQRRVLMAPRSHIAFVLIVAVSFFSSSCGPGTGSHGLKAWYVDSLVKVFPDDGIGTGQLARAEYTAARNQHVNIQICLALDASLPGGYGARWSRPRMIAVTRSPRRA